MPASRKGRCELKVQDRGIFVILLRDFCQQVSRTECQDKTAGAKAFAFDRCRKWHCSGWFVGTEPSPSLSSKRHELRLSAAFFGGCVGVLRLCEYGPISELSTSRYSKSVGGATPSSRASIFQVMEIRARLSAFAEPWEEAYALSTSSALRSKMY